SVDHQRIGIVGMGRIGQEIARKLGPFEADIAYHARSEKDVPYRFEPDLVALARSVDCLIVITPGGAATYHLIDRAVLEALGPGGTLINVARGSVVDETALVSCLETGRLGWAGLDVFEAEPKVPEALKAMKNVVLLPHVGSATHETRAAMGKLVIDNLVSHARDGTVQTPVPESLPLLAGRALR
ncbi:MAG: NAD(P)-dependent oxidoreductase, partial [Pseudomonadota bacterium]